MEVHCAEFCLMTDDVCCLNSVWFAIVCCREVKPFDNTYHFPRRSACSSHETPQQVSKQTSALPMTDTLTAGQSGQEQLLSRLARKHEHTLVGDASSPLSANMSMMASASEDTRKAKTMKARKKAQQADDEERLKSTSLEQVDAMNPPLKQLLR